MINEITCNSNNAIQLSRGELLQWLNQLLKLNYSKIEQMGTGAAYCQLLDIIYPGKVPLGKVNWKAKFEYEYLNNFKVLQQSFTKLNILRHIDVEKLVKCKYQDNLELLQWFKKICDSYSQNKDYDALTRRGEKQNKSSHNGSNLNISTDSFSKEILSQKMQISCQDEGKQREKNDEQIIQKIKIPNISPKVDENIQKLLQEQQNQEKQYYIKKLKEIDNLLDKWDCSRKCDELIDSVRQIILVAPEIQWDNEQFV